MGCCATGPPLRHGGPSRWRLRAAEVFPSAPVYQVVLLEYQAAIGGSFPPSRPDRVNLSFQAPELHRRLPGPRPG